MRAPKGVPRDEWLLAIGLADRPLRAYSTISLAIDPTAGSVWSAAFNGAVSVLAPRSSLASRDAGDPDAYAAGAALAMALEGP